MTALDNVCVRLRAKKLLPFSIRNDKNSRHKAIQLWKRSYARVVVKTPSQYTLDAQLPVGSNF
jgi:hypothetical protein